MIAEAIEEAYKEEESFERKGLWVSDLGYCVRKIGYHWAGYPRNPKTGAAELRMQDGKAWERQLEDVFTRAGWPFQQEVRVQLERITGKADFVIDHPETGKMVVEAKTVSAFMAGKCEEQPMPEHKLQCLAYMQALGLEFGVVVYKVLGSQTNSVREFFLSLSDPGDRQVLREALARLTDADFGSDGERIIPPHPYKKPERGCRMCDYSERCWADYKAPPFDVPEPERQSAASAYIESWRKEKAADAELKLAREVLEEKLRMDQDDEIACPGGGGVCRKKTRDSIVVTVDIDEQAAKRLLPAEVFAQAAELVVTPEAVKGLHDNGLIPDEAFAVIYVKKREVKPGSYRLTVVE
jgi:CRISPR/Cas system-associated exonuclease Cas4 (RecB family)